MLSVGTPPQLVRLLPGTSATAANAIWVVLPEGCTKADGPRCSESRGLSFLSNVSSTWSTGDLPNKGLFSLVLSEESPLRYNGNARYGWDTVTLGFKGSGLPTLKEPQLVAGIATKDFYLGSLGLSPLPMNFSGYDDPRKSLVQSLRDENKIPSLTWAYTAGAYYHQPPVYGSVTLGGYDRSRFVPNNLTFSFGADQSRDLLVGLQSISSDSSKTPLLPAGIYAFINSLIPHMWLPMEVCKAFEDAFALQWDKNTELYLLTDDQHQSLLKRNANVTLKLGPSAVSGESVDIVMPYRSFDLTISSPFINGSSKYFPLRRAQNSTQYTLGRVFLQQAYVIADYERHTFSVHQALFPSTSTPQDVIAIRPLDEQQTPVSQLPPKSTPSNSPLSTGAVIGIAIGAPIPLLIGLAICMFRHLRRRHALPGKKRAKSVIYETEAREIHQKHELEASEDTTSRIELPDKASCYVELPA